MSLSLIGPAVVVVVVYTVVPMPVALVVAVVLVMVLVSVGGGSGVSPRAEAPFGSLLTKVPPKRTGQGEQTIRE